MVAKAPQLPITHWSFTSLITYLRNPLAWYKRFVEGVYDTPMSAATAVGRAAHVCVQNFYSGISKEGATAIGLQYLRNIADFEINFGKASSGRAKAQKRKEMEAQYHQAVGYYLKKPPKYNVVAIEMKGMAKVEGLPLPIKAISDLVVVSKVDRHGLDIIDHKFVSAFSPMQADKSLFVLQAIFNYYTVKKTFNKPVRRFIVHECKMTRNRDNRPQMRRYVVDFRTFRQEFIIFNRLIRDATASLAQTRVFLPNPSDIFEGENSFDIYRINLVPEAYDAHFKPDE